MITVYYSEIQSDDPGLIEVCTTEKAYWDANHCVDDGAGQHYEAISDAMQACGAPEVCESVFETGANDLPGLIDRMAAKGFRLTRDAEFDAFLKGDGD